MIRRQALLLMSMLPAAQIRWAESTLSKPFLRLVLFGNGALDRFEIVGPAGETVTYTAQEIWDALQRKDMK